jgi:dsDNA-specific endonuclease/ATPase MutS2
VLFAQVLCLKLIHESKFNKIQILGINDLTQKISDFICGVQDKVAKDVFMILIKQARDQALKMNTDRPEALEDSYQGMIGIIGEEFNMDFMVSAPDDFIEEAKQEIIRLNREFNSLMDKKDGYKSKVKELSERVNRLEQRESDLEDEVNEFKSKIEELNIKLKECKLT